MTIQLENRLLRRIEAGNLRKLQLISSAIDFSSNDYLGLARSGHLLSLVHKEWEEQMNSPLNGLGSTGSRLLTGNSAYAQLLEEKIAQFHGYEEGLLFNCGYMANLGLLSTIGTEGNIIFFDKAIHASMYDGIRLGHATAFPFRHNDLEHLEKRLQRCLTQEGDRFICVESIYSTDGSMAPLKEIAALAKQYDAHLIVDEAHAVAVYGPQGRGLAAATGVIPDIFAQVVTFGKGVGVHGAIVLGNTILKKAMLNFATSYIYTTALPLHALAAIKCSYDLFTDKEEERQQLQSHIALFSQSQLTCSRTHIQSLPIRGNEAVKAMAQKLLQEGFDVRALVSPTVQRGEERLRICLHAFNSEKDVRRLIHLLQQYQELYCA